MRVYSTFIILDQGPARWSVGKGAAAKPDDLSSASGAHSVEGKNALLRVVLWPPHATPSVSK